MPRAVARRDNPAGLKAGAPLSLIDGPADALAVVHDEMAAAELALARLLMSDVREVPEIAGHLAAAGGKRLRPALTALSARALGYESDRLAELMCVGELIHLGSLLHDDVVDGAAARRGRPSANTVFGNAVSVLTGDFCLARAIWLAAEAGGPQAVAELGRTVTLMAEGEVLQLVRAGDLGATREQYIEVVERKSAALISWCAAAPALALGDADAAEALTTFGHRTGVAFQITDDVLDYSPGTGKDPGADLRERKVTLPLLYAMDRLDGLRDELGEPELDVPEMIGRIRASGALDDALAEARALAADGLAALDGLPPGQGRDALAVLGRYLVERAV